MLNFVNTNNSGFVTILNGRVATRDEVEFFGSTGKHIKSTYKEESFILLDTLNSCKCVVIPVDNLDSAKEMLLEAVKIGVIYSSNFTTVDKGDYSLK